MPHQRIVSRISLALLFIALIGLADSSYLAAKHFQGEPVNCSLIQGCDIVTSSQYSTIGKIPVALLGSLYYLTIVVGSVLVLDTKKVSYLRKLALLTIAGFLASLYFVILQLFVIKAICLYCMLSALTSTILFGLGMFAYKTIHE